MPRFNARAFGVLGGLALVACCLTGCSKPAEPVAESPAPPPEFVESTLPAPADPVLALGQRVYRSDCANCHNRGKKGAPRIAERSAWQSRLSQGVDTLIAHATRGYAGPAGDEMPARGGNDDLTDAEVAAAVRYLISHVP